MVKRKPLVKRGKGVVVLTKTPYSKVPKKERENKKTLFVDVTGYEEYGGDNAIIFRGGQDPTSIYLLLEQILAEAKPDYVHLESTLPFELNLPKIEVLRFLDKLKKFLYSKGIKLFVEGEAK